MLDKKRSALVQGYLKKSKEKLEVAKTLLKASLYDDAVSRAYYSAYYAAQAIFLAHELSLPRTHQGLVSLFGEQFVKTGKLDKKFGRILAELKDDRERSDYEVYSMIDKQTVAKAIMEAGQIFQTIRSVILGASSD